MDCLGFLWYPSFIGLLYTTGTRRVPDFENCGLSTWTTSKDSRKDSRCSSVSDRTIKEKNTLIEKRCFTDFMMSHNSIATPLSMTFRPIFFWVLPVRNEGPYDLRLLFYLERCISLSRRVYKNESIHKDTQEITIQDSEIRKNIKVLYSFTQT